MKFSEVLDYKIWYEKYKKYKKWFWGVMVSVVLVVVVLCAIPKQSDNLDFFDEAIKEYEDSTGVKIYPYGYNCLRLEAEKRGLSTKAQVIKLIVENEKWF